MKSTLTRWSLIPVAVLTLLLSLDRAEAQRTRQRPGNQPGNNQFGGPRPGGGAAFGRPAGQFGNPPANDPVIIRPGGGLQGDVEHRMDQNGWRPAANNNPAFNNNNPAFNNKNQLMSNAEAEKATRKATGGMIAMGIASLVLGLVILGCVGWLVVQNGSHSAAPSSGPRRRKGRD